MRNNSISRITEAAAKLEKKGFEPDPRLWKAPRDKEGNGSAVIRFLPEHEDNELPWDRFWDHFYKNPKTGMYYVERSLTSIGQKDPMGELNSADYNSGSEARKALAQARKRKLKYVSNIYVVSDPARPENEGKVFIFEYGKKIHDKLMEAMEPEDEDDPVINPFDPFEGGANFRLKVRKVDTFPNYDKSSFANLGPILDGDEDAIEEVYAQVHDLDTYALKEGYKTYDELKAKLDQVMGNVDEATQRSLSMTADQTPIPEVDAPSHATSAIDTGSDEDDEDLGFGGGDDDEDVSSYFDRIRDED